MSSSFSPSTPYERLNGLFESPSRLMINIHSVFVPWRWFYVTFTTKSDDAVRWQNSAVWFFPKENTPFGAFHLLFCVAFTPKLMLFG